MQIRAKGFRIGYTVKLDDSEKYGCGNAYPLPDGCERSGCRESHSGGGQQNGI